VVKMSSRPLFCGKCDTYSIISRKGSIRDIPIYSYWCKNRCGESFVKPIDMTQIEELREALETENEEKGKQLSLF